MLKARPCVRACFHVETRRSGNAPEPTWTFPGTLVTYCSYVSTGINRPIRLFLGLLWGLFQSLLHKGPNYFCKLGLHPLKSRVQTRPSKGCKKKTHPPTESAVLDYYLATFMLTSSSWSAGAILQHRFPHGNRLTVSSDFSPVASRALAVTKSLVSQKTLG